MHTFENIVDVLREEREYQKKVYGPEHDKQHVLFDLIKYMMVYIHKARNESAHETFENNMEALDALRKATALGVAAMEQFGYTRRYVRDTKPNT